MDISPATIGAVSAAVVVPLFFALMRNVDTLKHSSDSEKTLEELSEEYGRWETASSLLFIVFAAMIGFLLWKGLGILSAWHMSYFEKSIYLIPQPAVIWGFPALFLAIFLSSIPMHYLYLLLLGKQRYAEYTEYGNQKSGVDSWKLLRYMGYVFIPVCLAFTFLAFDSYVRVTSSSFIVNRFFSVGEVEYSFREIEAVELIKSFRAPNGNIVRRSHYIIGFSDGTHYNFHKSMNDLDFGQQEQVAEYVSQMSSLNITIVDPYP